MVRQQLYPNIRKEMDAFSNFANGMNTTTSNENLRDSEMALLINADLNQRGSINRRTGMTNHLASVGTGLVQGYFRYFKKGVLHSQIVARNGVLYRNGTVLPIEGLPTGFQNTRTIEAVQYQEKMYFATGTKLVQYDGEVCKVVEAYRPQPLEALYIGTNSLADNPDDYMTDGTSVYPRLDGVTVDRRFGVVQEPITLTAYVSKPPNMVLQYKFERKMPNAAAGEYLITQDWSDSKVCIFVTSLEGDYEIKVTLRDKANPTFTQDTYDPVQDKLVPKTLDKVVSEYYIPKYKVKPVLDPKDLQLSTPTVQTCNRIVLHWDRLLMHGDPSQPSMLYMSHLKSPNYFPTSYNLLFEEGKGENLTKILQYRGMIVAFTETTVQSLTGTNPLDYKRTKLNTTVGCPYPDTAKVMGNYIAFMSREGLMVLKTVYGTEDQANVARIDGKIANILGAKYTENSKLCATVSDGQYHLVLPEAGLRFRYYYEPQVWTMDESPHFDFERMYVFEGRLYGQSKDNGSIQYFNPAVFSDLGHKYAFRFESKHHDFSTIYAAKKLKELQLLASVADLDTSVEVYVYADETRIWNVAETDTTSDRSMWTEGKSYYDNGTSQVYKLKIKGKGRTVKLVITQTDDKPFSLYGYGFIFKTKSPR